MPPNGHDLYRTDEEVIKALYETGGNVNETAKLLKLGSVSLRTRIRNNPALKEAMLEAREQLLDIAENAVAKQIKRRNPNIDTVKWYLTKQGRSRGYGDVVTTQNLNVNYDIANLVEELREIPVDNRMNRFLELESDDANATE